jgi:hypothetical protein
MVMRWSLRIGMVLASVLGTAAIYYSTIEPHWLRTLSVSTFFVVVTLSCVTLSMRIAASGWAIAMAAVIVWFILDKPSNDRDWAPEYAVLTTWSQDGGVVYIHNIRNFTYNTEGNYTPAYYDANYALADLSTVDLVTSYWSGDAIAHVFLSFGFADGRHLAISIETRRQKKFGYSTIAGLFRHYELFYVVADERDLIGVRTDVRHEDVYLYRLNLPADVRTRLFLSYLDEVKSLAARPEWYNTITDNCTTGILKRADAKADVRYDWRILLSGYSAQLAYDKGLLNIRRASPCCVKNL